LELKPEIAVMIMMKIRMGAEYPAHDNRVSPMVGCAGCKSGRSRLRFSDTLLIPDLTLVNSFSFGIKVKTTGCEYSFDMDDTVSSRWQKISKFGKGFL
jgi:hypothetical protein